MTHTNMPSRNPEQHYAHSSNTLQPAPYLTLFNAYGLTGIPKVFGERQPAGVVIYQGSPLLNIGSICSQTFMGTEGGAIMGVDCV